MEQTTLIDLAIGCDHAGFDLKEEILPYLREKGYNVKDLGTYSTDSVDYPDFVHPVADEVESGKAGFGILICGSGNGVCIAANKHKGIRAALCWTPELAALSRQHNDANILCIPSRFISSAIAKEMLMAFLTTSFEGGRHQTRVNKITIPQK